MTSDVTMIFTLFKVIFGALGIFLVIIPGIVLSSIRKKRKLCTVKLKARIVDEECVETFSIDGYQADSWCFVYEFTINGMTMRKRSSTRHAHKKNQKGRDLVIYINPKNPNEFYSSEEKEELIPKVFIGIGILLIILCVVVMVLGL